MVPPRVYSASVSFMLKDVKKIVNTHANLTSALGLVTAGQDGWRGSGTASPACPWVRKRQVTHYILLRHVPHEITETRDQVPRVSTARSVCLAPSARRWGRCVCARWGGCRPGTPAAPTRTTTWRRGTTTGDRMIG